MPWPAKPAGRLISKHVSSGNKADLPPAFAIANTAVPKKKYGYTACRVSTASKPHDSYASARWTPHHTNAPKMMYATWYRVRDFMW